MSDGTAELMDKPAAGRGAGQLLWQTLRSWGPTWGLLLLVILAVAPADFRLGPGWLSLHTALEIAAVLFAGMIFVIGRNVLIFNGSAAGLYAGSVFLVVAILDTAHLLSFPGMPDWLTHNEHAKSITFWLMARLAAAAGLLIAITFDWTRRESALVRQSSLLAAVLAGAVLVPGGAWFAEAFPGVFWASPGLTASKIAVEYLIIALLLLAFVQELRRDGSIVPYRRSGMLAALLTLIASEWCFSLYARSNDAYIVIGHLYKLVGYFLLYRTLVFGMIRVPFRKLAAAEATASRKGAELEAIFQSAPDGVVLVGEDGNILKINPRFTELLGYEESQVRGLSVDILLPQRYRGSHRQHIASYMVGPKTRTMAAGRDLHARRRDGSEFPVDISLSPVEIDGRRCVIATIRDVSERAAMVRQLTESELRVRSFLDNSVDWVWETDQVGLITYSSQRVSELLGYTPEEVVGRTLGHFMTETDAIQLGPQIREIVIRREPMLHMDHSNRTKSGEVRLLETNARPHFEPGGRFMGYRGVTRDVTANRDLQRALEKSERVFRHAFDDFPTGMAFVDCSGSVLRVNAYLMTLLGYSPGELETQSLPNLIPVDQRWALSQEILALSEGRNPLYAGEVRLLRKDGQLLWVRLAAAMVDAADGSSGHLLLMISDISTERTAASHNARLLEIIERMGDAVAVADRTGKLLYLNPFARSMLGVDLNEDVSGESIQSFHPEPVGRFLMGRALPQAEHSGVWEGEIVWRNRSGEEILTWQVMMVHRDPAGDLEYWTVVARDIRERKLMEDRLSYQATHDALTGLPNRLLMRDRLQQAISTARRERKLLAVVFIDLDNFKRINDTLGHAYGDIVLVEVAACLREVLRSTDTLARQGGDEFIVLLPGLGTVNDVVGIAEKMTAALTKSILVDGREVFVTASLGVSVFPFDHDNGDELLRKADVAMYRAKEQGRNGYQFYTSDMDERFNQDLQMEIELRHAIGNGELVLYYQPKVSLQSGQVTGYEALVRWNHPKRGLVPPGEFIPVAERSMLIAHLGEWVMQEACRQLVRWRELGHALLPVAVNVSAQQFEYMDIPRFLRSLLIEQEIDGGLLELEITEGVLMRDPVATTRALNQIKALGVNIAVDDFGTGYSSLGYLKQFPVDVLKIDRSFVADVPQEADDAAIVRAIVSMANNLDIRVVAEGVETVGQLEFLRECACDYVQGYYFGRPLPASQVVLPVAGP